MKKKSQEEHHPFLKKVLEVMKDNLPSSIAKRQRDEETMKIARELKQKQDEERRNQPQPMDP